MLPSIAFAQKGTLYGQVKDSIGNKISLASLAVSEFKTGASTDSAGYYRLTLPANVNFILKISHINYIGGSFPLKLEPGEEKKFDITLKSNIRVLDSVSIISKRDNEIDEQVSLITLNPRDIEVLPSPFNDFNQILATLPGVISNNELSSTYSVRGGNYDENLVYVNDIPIYRPFLIRAGAQEGLSFINPSLTEEATFSSGGWQPKYGDALASTLNVKYKEPKIFGGSLSIGLLGGNASVGGTDKNKRMSYMVGVRHKRAEYLLNTLETEGEYYPRFTDVQSYLNFNIGKRKNSDDDTRTQLGVLFAYSKNKYQVIPESRETSFGTFNQPLNIFIAFDGQEISNYNTFQGAIKLSHQFSDKFSSHLILSDYYSREREYFDIEGGYRICDVDKNPGSPTFNECVTIRGIGTAYESARNLLNVNVVNSEIRNELVINDNNNLEFGIGYAYQHFEDHLHEYGFIDSAGYVTLTDKIDADNNTRSNVYTGYLQHHTTVNYKHHLTYGFRFNYQDFNDQFIISPRIQYAFKPEWRRNVTFRSAIGLYQQQPFYREFRGYDGSINENLKPQKSIHVIAGIDYAFTFWGRDFKLLVEGYYKYLDDLIPYDINDVRIRYYADNIAKGYATGLDLRVSGEFVPGDESWFSLGFLSTKEDLDIDNRGYIPRPTDQLINFNIFFQDHFPNNPSYRVYLNVNYVSGLPFGPPNNLESRNVFKGKSYQRIDLGFSKIFFMKNNKSLESIWLGIEVLNLTGRQNNISYFWVKDFNNIYYGVPNSLTTRFFNVKLKLSF